MMHRGRSQCLIWLMGLFISIGSSELALAADHKISLYREFAVIKVYATMRNMDRLKKVPDETLMALVKCTTDYQIAQLSNNEVSQLDGYAMQLIDGKTDEKRLGELKPLL